MRGRLRPRRFDFVFIRRISEKFSFTPPHYYQKKNSTSREETLILFKVNYPNFRGLGV
jgi:hypothetical protein